MVLFTMTIDLSLQQTQPERDDYEVARDIAEAVVACIYYWMISYRMLRIVFIARRHEKRHEVCRVRQWYRHIHLQISCNDVEL